jgi:hypothetical protein
MKAICHELSRECRKYATDYLQKKPTLDTYDSSILQKFQSCFELRQKEENSNEVLGDDSNSSIFLPSTSHYALNRNLQPTVMIRRLNVNKSTVAHGFNLRHPKKRITSGNSSLNYYFIINFKK